MRRLASLDVFRGITVAAMILVNNPGAFRHVYPVLRHADWNGCRPADFIFPFFVFIVGVAITLSVGARRARGVSGRRLLAEVGRRTLALLALGLVLNGLPFFDWDVFRIPGVLQRIALCYGAAAVVVLTLDVGGQVAVAVCLLAGYWIVMTRVPVPGFGAGDLGPHANLAAYVDRRLMPGHLGLRDMDPEGLLTTIPAIASTLAGALAGRWLETAPAPGRRLGGLVLAGAACIGLGLLLAPAFPLNKTLWSPPYAILTTGAALLLLAALHWVVDLHGIRRWALPFAILGTNALVAYVGSAFAAKAMLLVRVTGGDGTRISLKRWLYEGVLQRAADPDVASLLFALANVLLWLAVAAVLHRKRIIVKL